MVQALATAAKQGDPKAIAMLLNKSLAAHGIAAKALRQGDRLSVLLEATTLPEREALLRFLQGCFMQLRPENIAVVSVQGRTLGQTQPAWHASFRLNFQPSPQPTASPPESKPTASELDSSILVKHASGRSIRYKAKPKPRHAASRLVDVLSSRNGERAGLIAATFLLTSVLWSLFGVGGGTQSPSLPLLGNGASQTLRGRLTLIDTDIAEAGDRCYGTGSYDDIAGNLRVTVRDGQNQLLATGETQAGRRPTASSPAQTQCVFEFRLDVPRADFYTIAIGRRGELSYSWQELRAQRWQVDFTLDP